MRKHSSFAFNNVTRLTVNFKSYQALNLMNSDDRFLNTAFLQNLEEHQLGQQARMCCFGLKNFPQTFKNDLPSLLSQRLKESSLGQGLEPLFQAGRL